MWTRGRGTADWVATAGGDRLQHLARQWRIPAAPGTGPPSQAAESLDEPISPWRLLADDHPAPVQTTSDPASTSVLTTGGWSRSAVRGLAVLVGVTVLLAGWWWWSGRPRPAVGAPRVVATGMSVPGASASTAGPPSDPSSAPRAATAVTTARVVIVHVVGQVRHPGLVTLPVGSRVDDAVKAAGGVSRPHAADSVNLARVLVDGEQVVVGFAAQAVAGVLGIGPAKSAGPLNLNSADETALDGLPGVGPVLAQRIVQWRVANGPFRSVDELGEVSGIGDAIMAQLRPLVTV